MTAAPVRSASIRIPERVFAPSLGSESPGSAESVTYNLTLYTSQDWRSDMTQPDAGVTVALVGKNGNAVLHTIPRQGTGVAYATQRRFMAGAVDRVSFQGPDVQPIDALWVAPEAGGTWRLQQALLTIDETQAAGWAGAGDGRMGRKSGDMTGDASNSRAKEHKSAAQSNSHSSSSSNSTAAPIAGTQLGVGSTDVAKNGEARCVTGAIGSGGDLPATSPRPREGLLFFCDAFIGEAAEEPALMLLPQRVTLSDNGVGFVVDGSGVAGALRRALSREEVAAMQADSLAAYGDLKRSLATATAVIGAATSLAMAGLGGADIGRACALGACGGLAYLLLLEGYVDSMQAPGGGAGSQGKEVGQVAGEGITQAAVLGTTATGLRDNGSGDDGDESRGSSGKPRVVGEDVQRAEATRARTNLLTSGPMRFLVVVVTALAVALSNGDATGFGSLSPGELLAMAAGFLSYKLAIFTVGFTDQPEDSAN
eukprot:jgi/Mesvir1/1298/Mv03763-RA.1